LFSLERGSIIRKGFAYVSPFTLAMDNLIVGADIRQNKTEGLAKFLLVFEVKAMLDKGEDFIF
jgi:hypothetical protein